MVYDETRGVLKTFLRQLICDAVTYTIHANRTTVTALDVIHALKLQGRKIIRILRDEKASTNGTRDPLRLWPLIARLPGGLGRFQ